MEMISAFMASPGLTGVARQGISPGIMTPSYRLGLAMLVTVLGTATAQPPAREPPVILGPTGAPPGPARPPLALLLDDFRIVDGDVRKTADGYEIHRGKQIETIPAKRVLFAGESLADVQQFLKARAAGLTAKKEAPTESMKLFAAKIQPVLTSGCANCHARADHTSRFKIVRVPEGYAASDSLAKNAAAATAFLDPADLANSPLLVKSITAHGGQRTPSLYGRTHPAFHNLETWVREAAPAVAKSPAVAPTPKPVDPVSKPTLPNDPFDPEPFNKTVRRESRR
jgi:hypothetical protein